MYSGTDSCSSCEKRDKYTDSCRGCSQSIKTPFTRESTVYTGLDKFLNGRIVSLYNPFTRNRANSVTVLLIQVRTNFCQPQRWNGFLIKGAEPGSTLLTRKLCKHFYGRTDRTGQNFWPTADQVKNLHGSGDPEPKCGSVQGFVLSTIFPDPWSCMCVSGKKRKCPYQHF